MKLELNWYDKAEEELDEIHQFYIQKSRKAADKIYNTILDEAQYLRSHPYIGVREPDLDEEDFLFRSLVVMKGLFKIIYCVDKNTIKIMKVWCCRANPEDMIR